MTSYDAVLNAARCRATTTPDLTSPRVAWGRCVIESAALVEQFGNDVHLLSVSGLNYPGRKHSCAVVALGEEPADWPVIDLTMRQFIADAPVPWTGSLTDWYDVVVDVLGDHLTVECFERDHDAALSVAEEPWWTDRYTDRDDVEPGASVTYAEGAFV